MPTINVNIPNASYSIFIENELIENLATKILPKEGKYLVVISEKVEKLYGKFFNIPKLNKFVLKDGEEQKNFKNYQRILDKAFELKLTRKDCLVAIGGGVVGDLTGFAASTYMRGIGFVQVPTTLLACVDSSVGGKTAINTKFGKNLVGSFYQPRIVYINPRFIKTLDDRQFKSGLGEVLKYGFIEKNCFSESDFTKFIVDNHDKILKRDEDTIEKIIEICINFKKNIVERDEKENGLRKILNFGHTYAHAIERITNYKCYTHGEAVIEGMRYAFDIACRKGLIDESYKTFANDLFDKFGYKKLPKFNSKKISEIMQTDKKANSNGISFVLPTEYAKVDILDMNCI